MATDFWAGLGDLAWPASSDLPTHAEVNNITARTPARETTKRRVRRERCVLRRPVRLVAPMDVTPTPVANLLSTRPYPATLGQVAIAARADGAQSLSELKGDRHRLEGQQWLDVGINAFARETDRVHGLEQPLRAHEV